jgi:hypothetical protein
VIDLLERRRDGRIFLCTSSVALEEMDRHAHGGTTAARALCLLLEAVPLVDEDFRLASMYGSARYGAQPYGLGPLVRDDALAHLELLLPHRDDARHLFHAARNGITYFVTCDARSILHFANEIEGVVGVRPRSPRQLVAELEARAS